MYGFLKNISRTFLILAAVSTVFLIPVFAYLHDYLLEFNFDKNPVVLVCILGFLILQPVSYIFLAVFMRKLEKRLFVLDLEVSKKNRNKEN